MSGTAFKVSDRVVAETPQGGAADLLGGTALLKRKVRSRLDVHDVLEHGIPSGAFNFLLSRVKVLEPDAVRKAVGLSVRTVQRRNQTPRKPLSPEQSGRAWKFAEVLAQATDVLGGQDAAEQWLNTPALAFERRRPVELLSTAVGAEMVERLLTQIDHGVYV
jgi:putative toxin-antitoxin system antitoxin component (TIGR02293 family)